MRGFLAAVIRTILRAIMVIGGSLLESWVGPWLSS
jgi:hypothetical protein